MDKPISADQVDSVPLSSGLSTSDGKDQHEDSPCTPPLTPTQLDLGPDGLQGGSIVLIDPTTSGIIGTLTPASPPQNGLSETEDEAIASQGAGASGDKTPQRRDPTYSYRLSISDLSLRTFNAAGSTIFEAGEDSRNIRTSAEGGVVAGAEIEAKEAKGTRSKRSSWMTDDASFWTARGTLRMDGPASGEGHEREREVVVAYVKADASLNDLFPPYIPSPSRPTHAPANLTPSTPSHRTSADPSMLSTASRLTAETDSPFPSRILHLFPRLSTLPRNQGGSAGSGLPSSVTQGLSWPSLEGVDAGMMMASAGSHAEAAFWRLVMPGISGIYGWTGVLGQAYETMAAYLPLPLLTSPSTSDNAPLLIDSSVEPGREARLYSEETIYTLRMPSLATDDPSALDLGPTVRPVWVKKRAALPVFPDMKEDWGREGGMRQHI